MARRVTTIVNPHTPTDVVAIVDDRDPCPMHFNADAAWLCDECGAEFKVGDGFVDGGGLVFCCAECCDASEARDGLLAMDGGSSLIADHVEINIHTKTITVRNDCDVKFTVDELYDYVQEHFADSGLDEPLPFRTTGQHVQLSNGVTIDESVARRLYGGSVSQTEIDGTHTMFSSLVALDE